VQIFGGHIQLIDVKARFIAAVLFANLRWVGANMDRQSGRRKGRTGATERN